VAVVAGREPDALELLVRVALLAGDFQVRAGQRIGRLCVVEDLAALLEGDRGGMAAPAGLGQLSRVGILVARRAVRLQREERPDLVAGRAVDLPVLAVEDESRLELVIECLRLDHADLGVRARVLDMAGDAVGPGLAVDALLRGDPLGDGLVALEALRGGDPLSGLVAFLAVVQPFPLGVRSRERARRDELPELLGRRPRATARRARSAMATAGGGPAGSRAREARSSGRLSQKCTE